MEKLLDFMIKEYELELCEFRDEYEIFFSKKTDLTGKSTRKEIEFICKKADQVLQAFKSSSTQEEFDSFIKNHEVIPF